MKERPILFSAPMVLALLAGTKTQTRRVVKLRGAERVLELADGSHWPAIEHVHLGEKQVACPYGGPVDRLWVRETWCQHEDNPHLALRAYYRADHPEWTTGDGGDIERWRPSIFMPRWASRIDLEVTEVRVERLNDISEADAIAEGVTRPVERIVKPGSAPPAYLELSHRDYYRDLWESINGAGSWAANPWVWVVEFKRVRP